MASSSRPGNELPKDYRKIARTLVDTQGWRYDPSKKHPMLYPPNRNHPPIVVPTTPGDKRSLRNFIAAVRRAGGII